MLLFTVFAVPSRYPQTLYLLSTIHCITLSDYIVLSFMCSRTAHLNLDIMEIIMNTKNINWDEVPETLSLEQFRKLIHVSKRAAKTLLDTEIPCVILAKTTHKYIIYKQDLINYLGVHPGVHFLNETARIRHSNSRLFPSNIPEVFKRRMAFYFTSAFAKCPELIRIRDVAEMIGYSKEQVGEWANEGLLPNVTISNIRYVSKSNLIRFLCTEDFDSVIRKSQWHKDVIEVFKEWK